MSQLNGKEELNRYVETDIFDFGEVGDTAIVDFSIPFLGELGEIEYIEKGCACSDAFFANGAIQGQIQIEKAGTYNKGMNDLSKYIFVYINDGQPRFLADSMKRKTFNPEKTFFSLELRGKVVKQN